MADRKPLVRVGGKSKQLPAGDSIPKAVVGLGNVTNDAQAKASIYPNTTPAAGRILVGQTTGKYESHAISGDATLSESGLVTISNGAATNAKQGPMAAGTLKGNKYAVTAAPQDLTPAEARSVLGLGTAAVVNTGTGHSDAILGNDARLSDSREWSADTVTQAEAEAGTATTRRAWTAQRVRQAIAAWWSSVTDIDGKSLGQTTPAEVKTSRLDITRTAVTAPAASDGNVYSGTYTPTLTNVTNVSSSTASRCQYMRVGDVVTVSGRVDILPTAAAGTQTVLGMSLPIASDLNGSSQLGGAGAYITSTAASSTFSRFRPDTASDRADIYFNANDASINAHFFSFTYLVR